MSHVLKTRVLSCLALLLLLNSRTSRAWCFMTPDGIAYGNTTYAINAGYAAANRPQPQLEDVLNGKIIIQSLAVGLGFFAELTLQDSSIKSVYVPSHAGIGLMPDGYFLVYYKADDGVANLAQNYPEGQDPYKFQIALDMAEIQNQLNLQAGLVAQLTSSYETYTRASNQIPAVIHRARAMTETEWQNFIESPNAEMKAEILKFFKLSNISDSIGNKALTLQKLNQAASFLNERSVSLSEQLQAANTQRTLLDERLIALTLASNSAPASMTMNSESVYVAGNWSYARRGPLKNNIRVDLWNTQLLDQKVKSISIRNINVSGTIYPDPTVLSIARISVAESPFSTQLFKNSKVVQKLFLYGEWEWAGVVSDLTIDRADEGTSSLRQPASVSTQNRL